MAHGEDGPRDLVGLLGVFYRQSRALFGGEYTNPQTTKVLRVGGLVLLLILCGPLAWAGLDTMPGFLIFLIILVIGLRILVAWWRRRQ